MAALSSFGASMSTLTRYGFTLLLVLYGLYRVRGDAPFTGALALALGALIFWLARPR